MLEKPKRILIVDDDPMVHELLDARLGDIDGYEIISRKDVTSSWAFLKRKRPDTVLLDWNLPDEPGIRLLRRIKGDFKRMWIPVFMLTGRCSMEEVERVLSEGANGYFTKPINLELISKRLAGLFKDDVAA